MMREVIETLLERLSRGRATAYCRLVETRGSTPRKAGAAMLVYPDGGQCGTLGGGCAEAEVKRRALHSLATRQTQVVCLDLDHDEGWNDGLICGGRLVIRIEPLSGYRAPRYLQHLVEALRRGAGLTEAVVIDERASGLPAGASFLFDEQGGAVAAHGASWEERAPARVQAELRPLASRPAPYVAGGVAYLPSAARCTLLIVGGGHVGQAVAALAAGLDFAVWVVDDREEYVSPSRFPHAARRIVGVFDEILPVLSLPRDTYCLIVTRGHTHDQRALHRLVNRRVRYVGMLGSRRKTQLIFDQLRDAGVPAESLARVYAPVGVDIGSQTVSEIAVSICAELVAHRNRGGVVPGKEDRGDEAR